MEKIFLVDIDKRMTSCWEKDFEDFPHVKVVNCDIIDFLNKNKDVDTIVAAANSFGFMDGGLDAAYIRYFSDDLQNAVLAKIREEYLGEQPVGSSMILNIPGGEGKKLIHTPSMRIPQALIDPRIIYTCTRSALVTAINNRAHYVLLPAFGHLTGHVKAEVVSYLMRRAYEDVCLRSEKNYVNTWQDVHSTCNIDDVLMEHFICR